MIPTEISPQCMWRRQLLRLEECPRCEKKKRRVFVKVFRCEKHAECTIQEQIGGRAFGSYEVCGKCHFRATDELNNVATTSDFQEGSQGFSAQG